MGKLINQASGEPLGGARVFLCQFIGEKVCTVRPDLAAITDKEGKFRIPNVKQGKYGVLYNASGKELTEWEGLQIDFTPVDAGLPVIAGIFESLGIETPLSGCAMHLGIVGLGKTTESGYIYSEELDLALILIESNPVSVNVRGSTTINLSVWNTRKGECNEKNFDPMQ